MVVSGCFLLLNLFINYLYQHFLSASQQQLWRCSLRLPSSRMQLSMSGYKLYTAHFWISTKVVYSALWLLHGWCQLKLLPSRLSFCSQLQRHFVPSHICRMLLCLAVTCHLPFWQNDLDLLCATVVTQGWNGHRNKGQYRKQTLEKNILWPLQRDSNPRPFDHKSGTLTTELHPLTDCNILATVPSNMF